MQYIYHNDTTSPWSLKQVIIIFLSGILLNIVVGFGIGFIETTFPHIIEQLKDVKSVGITMFITYIIQLICFILPILCYARFLKLESWREALYILPVEKKTLMLSVVCGQLGSLFIFNALSFAMWMWGIESIPGYSGTQEPLSDFFGSSTSSYFFAFISVSLLAPFVEEVFFRGMLQTTLYKYISAPFAVIIASLVFALIHFQLQVFIPLFLMGVLFGTMTYYTKSIIPSMILHSINNAFFILAEILK